MTGAVRSIAKGLASRVTRLLAKSRLKKAAAGRPDKLVIGASTTRAEGWLSTDISPRARYYLDAIAPWPIAPASLRFVYADNMIEHVKLRDARRVLANAYDALTPGGTIRLVAPDVGETARIYLQPGPLRDAVLARSREDDGTPGTYPIDVLRMVVTQAGHHLGQTWDEEALTSELRSAGFEDVKRCAVGESEHDELRGLEQRSEPAVAATSLVLEARKPVPRES